MEWNIMSPVKPSGWFWEGYYEVTLEGVIVVCDDWTTAPVDMWCSYVVFPQEG